MRRPLLLLAALLAGCSSLPPAPRPAPRAVLDAHVRGLHALTFSPDGAMFASAGGGAADPAVDEITLWETATGARRMTFANYKGVVSSLAFSPDGKLLAVGDVQGRIALLEVDSGGERISFQAREGILICLSFTFDGSAIVSVVHSADEAETVEICRWDVTRGVPRETWQSQATTPLALSPDAGVLCWPEPGIGIKALDLESKALKLLSKVELNRGDPLVFSPDGKWLAAVHQEDWSPLPNHCPYVYLIDARSGRILLRSPRPFDARRGLTISHDSKLLARGVDNGFQLWDLKLMQVEANVAEPSDRSEGARMLAFSPDDKTLVSTDGRGLLLLWDVARLVPARRQ